ncbi:DUF3817 domain-containing protein [Kitasatospora sp. NPDC093558]|uniref:DUF3817 domain-containing protein n=1 Tax=Kitasatospora sp. NPDC093558 TaxID=3155201 RepID=UPI003438A141
MNSSAVHRLRLVSAPEGLSWILLIICTVLKYSTSFNAVPVLGPIHGTLFILYVVFWIQSWQTQKWDRKRGILLFVLSVVPFGGIYTEQTLAKEERGELEPAVA